MFMYLAKLLDEEIAADLAERLLPPSQSDRQLLPKLQLGGVGFGRCRAVRLHRLGDQPVDYSHLRVVVAGPRRECVVIDLELVVGAGSAPRDGAGMLHFGDAAERLGMGPQDLDQLVDELGQRHDDPLAEVRQFGLDPVTLRPPFILEDQDAPVLAPALVVVAQVQQEGQD